MPYIIPCQKFIVWFVPAKRIYLISHHVIPHYPSLHRNCYTMTTTTILFLVSIVLLFQPKKKDFSRTKEYLNSLENIRSRDHCLPASSVLWKLTTTIERKSTTNSCSELQIFSLYAAVRNEVFAAAIPRSEYYRWLAVRLQQRSAFPLVKYNNSRDS